jgi:hypothetical protein
VRAALDGTIGGSSEIARKEMATKGAAYMVIWMRVVGELHASLDFCNAGKKADSMKSLDAAWALYAGVEEGSSDNSGLMPYRLAEKRAGNFDTAGASGTSRVNEQLLVRLEYTPNNTPTRAQHTQHTHTQTHTHTCTPLVAVEGCQG